MATIYQVKRVAVEVKFDEGDLIPLSEAAEIAGLTYQSLAGRLDSGTLDWYQFSTRMDGERRYVSRRQVQALTSAKAPGAPARRRGGVKRK